MDRHGRARSEREVVEDTMYQIWYGQYAGVVQRAKAEGKREI